MSDHTGLHPLIGMSGASCSGWWDGNSQSHRLVNKKPKLL